MLRRRGSQQPEETLGAPNHAHNRTARTSRKEAAVELVPRLAGFELGEVRRQLIDVTTGSSRIGTSGHIK
jgi:hypothetical protein